MTTRSKIVHFVKVMKKNNMPVKFMEFALASKDVKFAVDSSRQLSYVVAAKNITDKVKLFLTTERDKDLTIFLRKEFLEFISRTETVRILYHEMVHAYMDIKLLQAIKGKGLTAEHSLIILKSGKYYTGAKITLSKDQINKYVDALKKQAKLDPSKKIDFSLNGKILTDAQAFGYGLEAIANYVGVRTSQYYLIIYVLTEILAYVTSIIEISKSSTNQRYSPKNVEKKILAQIKRYQKYYTDVVPSLSQKKFGYAELAGKTQWTSNKVVSAEIVKYCEKYFFSDKKINSKLRLNPPVKSLLNKIRLKLPSNIKKTKILFL